MELLSLQSPNVARPPKPRHRSAMAAPAFYSGRPLRGFPSNERRHPHAKTPRFSSARIRAIGTVRGAASSKSESEVINQQKDNNLAFIAGATGRVGSRTVRELLNLGCQVKAGVRSAQRAEPLVKSVQAMEFEETTSTSGSPLVERLEIVECDLENQGEISSAIGSASIVICCIGASEKEISDITGPYRIDYKATKNLIDAATILKVDHFILLTSLGTGKIGFPAALLNLFWGVLYWKRKAEEDLIASGLPYTIVRPGGMERPTDAYKETHNLILANEDTYFGGQVSNLQVAELIAMMAKNRDLSFCKIVEVIAETTAPLTPTEELLSKIPSQRTDTSIPKETPKPSPRPVTISSESVVEVPPQPELQSPRPLSPYTMYDDLKPPSSPTPTPSITPGSSSIQQNIISESKPEMPEPSPTPVTISSESVEVVLPQPELQSSGPLSPYTMYDNLKPPSSPTPTPSSTPGSFSIQHNIISESKPVEVVESSLTSSETINDVVSAQLERKKSKPLSPYTAYEDLRPPTSPTPSAPIKKSGISDSKDHNAEVSSQASNSLPHIAAEAEKTETSVPQTRSACSPFTMYEDLKPPASPSPSCPRI